MIRQAVSSHWVTPLSNEEWSLSCSCTAQLFLAASCVCERNVQVPRDKMITLLYLALLLGWSFYLAVPVISGQSGGVIVLLPRHIADTLSDSRHQHNWSGSPQELGHLYQRRVTILTLFIKRDSSHPIACPPFLTDFAHHSLAAIKKKMDLSYLSFSEMNHILSLSTKGFLKLEK